MRPGYTKVVQAVLTPTFHMEPLTPRLRDELGPLLQQHYEEIAPWADIPLAPDWHRYDLLEKMGCLHIVTARLDHALIGYHCAIVMRGLHYSTVMIATQDVLWVAPEHRRSRVGRDLLTFAEDHLRASGCAVLVQHTKVKPGQDLGPWLTRRGYQPLDMLYAKRLDS